MCTVCNTRADVRPDHRLQTTDKRSNKDKTKTNLTFCGPRIVIYLRNKDQQDALFFLNLFQ